MEGGGNKLATLAELVVKVGADMSTLSKGLSESSKTMNRWAKQAEGSIGPVMDKIGQVAKVAGLAVVTGFSAATVAGVKLNAELEQSKIAFTTLLGSAERADAFLRICGISPIPRLLNFKSCSPPPNASLHLDLLPNRSGPC